MAAGVDGIAHRTVLETGGSTVAVLGSGVNYAYPRSHSSLHQSIANKGLVVSEFGDARVPFPGCFPRRNRIIAGLSSLTIVVEASLKSGALITANYAAEYGRTVAAVPGPITSEQSQGANQLIRDGANVIAHIDDALMLAGLSANAGVNVANEPKLEGDQALVWSAIASGRDVDAIGVVTGLSASRCAVAITMLEMQGLVTCLLNGELQKRR
jgi:DNA processing protein